MINKQSLMSLKICLAEFKNPCQKNIIMIYNQIQENQILVKFLNGIKVYFYNKVQQSDRQIWIDIFENLISFAGQMLFLSQWLPFNQASSLITLSRIYFPNLKQLIMIMVNIQSIEALQFLNAPNIEQLILGHNKICSIKPLFKFNFKKLQYIQISTNRIKSYTTGRQLFSKSKETVAIGITYLQMDSNHLWHSRNDFQIEDISFLAKFPESNGYELKQNLVNYLMPGSIRCIKGYPLKRKIVDKLRQKFIPLNRFQLHRQQPGRGIKQMNNYKET